ncbi:hypothetical protein M438DRAFT_366626 [Aureobasidium pullulans EXF-150]|uniref:Uncharacterized protein n=1 Tax=Aureobasidium pullulans EXF-150 TaxID=1043002 RepID=A0A074Y8T3_AURPU|nr:uncharacterized protein M438DRAFT_366626 [Aureobasidium pullulans EXF-150]KEQ83276.1 hypothetical protein M438DRAFT_366626 [Aureobasidium pullulans EXF-150]
MFFTSAQLSADPELRPITWSSPQAYQSERHYLYTQLAEALHISASSSATNSATTSTSDISNPSSNLLSPKSSRSDLASTKKRDSMISCSADTITTLASKKSASSLLNACSRKLVSPFLASSSSSSSTQVQKFKPVTFNSPQTSVFRFDTVGPTAASASASAATSTASATSTSTSTSITTTTTPMRPSPKKVDSVMGSPIKFLSPSLFKRNNNKIMPSGAAGKIIKSYAMVKESDTFNYFKGLGGGKKDGEDCDVSKKDIIHEPKCGDITTHNSEEKSENGKSGEKAEEAADANHTDNAKPAKTPLPVNPDINEKGILYIEYLGLAVVAASPKSMEEQYLFVKQQIQKSRDMGFEGSWS